MRRGYIKQICWLTRDEDALHDVSALQKEATSNEATLVEEAASNSEAASQEEDAQQQTSCFTCFT